MCGDEPIYTGCILDGDIRIPHMCGDEPMYATTETAEVTYTPHVWG